MSSCVYFRFKSQKEPSRVVFDGTGISVFDLKREIIALNHLGDGTDFELLVSSDETNEEFDDDTSIIPRSTTVIAKRLPALKPGRGGAARYVTGKMPQSSKNSQKAESNPKVNSQGKLADKVTILSETSNPQTEEQKIAAMFRMGAEQWAEQQQEMSHATPIHRVNTKKPNHIPDRPLPPGYICYRCGEKGHWIQVCPTNDDPSFDGRPRVKRTTGIPRSFLKTIEKPTVAPGDGISEESKQPVGVMVNAEGEWVIAEPDKASWDNYQAKAKASVAAREAAALGSKELQERGLECSIDKRLFEEPTKTPCCQSTYCHDCITNALLENDLRCPNCSAENVLIDNLEPDNEIVAKIRSYREEQEANKPQEDASNSPRKDVPLPKLQKKPNSLSPNGSVSESSNTSDANSASKVKKRPAESELENDRTSSGPLRLDPKQRSVMVAGQQHTSPQSIAFSGGPVSSQSSFAPNYTMIQGMNMMPLSNINGYGGFPMTLVPSMAMNPAMLNAMMMQGLSSMGAANSSWASSWEAGVSQQPCTNAAGAGVRNADYGQRHYYGPMGHGFINTVSSNQVSGGFSNQQRTAISTQNLNEEDSAYFRKPVNPHRHQARRNVNRPTDYREI